MRLREQPPCHSMPANIGVRTIEFIGFPGAGKTTVANALVREAARDGYEVHTYEYLGLTTSYRGWRKLRLLRTFAPDVWIFVVRLGEYFVLHCHQQRFQQLKRLYTVLWYYLTLRRYRASCDHGVLVLEHGIVNFLWLVQVDSRRSANDMRRIVEHIHKYLDVAYIYIEVSPSLAAKRIEHGFERERTIFDYKDYETNVDIFSTHRVLFADLIRMLNVFGSPLLVVDGELGVAEKTDIIMSWIRGASPM